MSVTSYSLKSDGRNVHHLIEYSIEGIINGSSWEELEGQLVTKT